MKTKTYALTAKPPATLSRGLRMTDRGDVDRVKAVRQHRRYVETLRGLGFDIIEMPAQNKYPDSVFVEDPAVIIQNILIITRMRREERRGEETLIEQTLTPYFAQVLRIEEPGFVEGGDVLITPNRLYIGISARTNGKGAEQLAKIAKDRFGLPTAIFEIPKHCLHLKGQATYHESGTGPKGIVMAADEIADHFSDSGCKIIVIPDEERFGANSISKAGQALIHRGRIKTRRLLEKNGFAVTELPMSEFEKIDGALSCLSKFFSPSP